MRPQTGSEVLAQLVAVIFILAVCSRMLSWAGKNLIWATLIVLAVVALWAVGYVLYRNRFRISRWPADLCLRAIAQGRAWLGQLRLNRRIFAAEQSVQQLHAANAPLIADQFDEDQLRRQVRRLKRADRVEQVDRWQQRREEQIGDLRRKYDQGEADEGPTKRSQARQEVRLFYDQHEPTLSRYVDRRQVEQYLRQAMHDGLPSRLVSAAGQRIIDHLQRQLMIHDLWQVFLDCRRWLAGSRSDDRMIRSYIRDSLGAHRPVEHVKKAADEMMQQLQHFTNVAKQQANADDSSAAGQDDPHLDIDQPLWDQIAEQVDSQLQAWGRSYSVEQREAEIRRRYQRIIGQQSHQ